MGRLVPLVALLAAPFALFLVFAEDVAEDEVLTWDTAILRWTADLRTPWLNQLMRVITDLGATVTLTLIVLALTVLLLRRRLRREALFLILSVGGAALLNALLKQLFQRPRPDVVTPVVTARGFAFPSGHTMSSMALACAIVVLSWRLRLRRHWAVALAAMAFAFFVGASRVYLGVHYPSDVLAGWLVSLDLVAVVYLLLFRRVARGVENGDESEATPAAAVGDRVCSAARTITPGGDDGRQA
jgi:membrane-associated phospholipid phosphatase